MLKETDNYFLSFDEPLQSCLLTLRSIILRQDDAITETQKWSLPCFCYKKKMFCFLSIDSKSGLPYLLIVEGRLIDHPMLERAGRKRMKHLSIDPEKDLPLEEIITILQDALNLYRDGIIKTK